MPKESDRFITRDNDFSMVLQEERLKSFDKCWPFSEKCSCTPMKMAEAGFYHCPTQQVPDGVRCFCCLKELDSWEPEDDPWKEHRKHTVDKGRRCEFVNIGKPQSALTVEEFLKVLKARHVALVMRLTELNVSEFGKNAAKVREEMAAIDK